MRAALCLILICGFAAAAVLDPRECHDNGNRYIPFKRCQAFFHVSAHSELAEYHYCPEPLVFDTKVCVCNWRHYVACNPANNHLDEEHEKDLAVAPEDKIVDNYQHQGTHGQSSPRHHVKNSHARRDNPTNLRTSQKHDGQHGAVYDNSRNAVNDHEVNYQVHKGTPRPHYTTTFVHYDTGHH